MLRVAVPTTAVFHCADSVSTTLLTLKSGMTSTVLAGDIALNDASVTATSPSTVRSTLQNSASHITSRTIEYDTSIDEDTPVISLREKPKNEEEDTPRKALKSSSSMRLLDSTILPIKSQITLRKLIIVLRMLLVLRLCSLCFQPVEHLSTSFPFIPPGGGTSRFSHTRIAFQDIPFVQHFTQHSPFALSTWTSFAVDLGFHVLRSIIHIGYDFFALHKLILSPETLVVVLLALLTHPITVWMDGRIHKEFYDHQDHRNIHQLPFWLSMWGKKGFKRMRLLLLIASVWPGSHELSREANLVLVLCTVWMSVFKRILKNLVDAMHIRSALRPPNQAFPRGMYFGGFPSGHVSQCFVAMLVVYHVWGLSNLMGLALLAQTLITFIWVVSANRHYLSQVIAGIALGSVYGFAAIAWLQRLYGPETFRAGQGHGWSLFTW